MTAKNGRTRSVAREIARLRRMSVAELVPEYERLHGKPPRVKHKAWLWRRCAWKLQEQRLGGLSAVAKKRLDELIAEIDLPLDLEPGTVTGVLRRRHALDLPLGQTIVRRWHGRDLRLTAVEDGFEVDGVIHASLSAAAKAVTGAKWNGRLFWLGKNGGQGA